MRQALLVLVFAIGLVLNSGSSKADPGAGAWVDLFTGAARSVINFDESIRFTITSAAESAAFTVDTPYADLCFDPDTGGSAGSARVTAYRIVNPTVRTINASIPITVPSDNSDCAQLVRGIYWVEVTVGPTGGEAAVVTVTGRAN